MNNLSWEQKALENDVVEVTFAIVGGGAADATVPASHKHVTKSGVRTGVGAITINAQDRAKFPGVLGVVGVPVIVGTGARQAFVTGIDADAGTISVQVRDGTGVNIGVAAELPATDTLYVTVRYRNSKVKYGEAL